MGAPEDLLANLLKPVALEPDPHVDRLAYQVLGARRLKCIVT
jgi:hypothetical protein